MHKITQPAHAHPHTNTPTHPHTPRHTHTEGGKHCVYLEIKVNLAAKHINLLELEAGLKRLKTLLKRFQHPLYVVVQHCWVYWVYKAIQI